jgi:hypothetical protein
VGRDGAATDSRPRAPPPAHPRFSGGARALERRTHWRLAQALAAAESSLGGLAGDDRGMGQDRHDAIDGEALGSQSVTFSDRLLYHRMRVAGVARVASCLRHWRLSGWASEA